MASASFADRLERSHEVSGSGLLFRLFNSRDVELGHVTGAPERLRVSVPAFDRWFYSRACASAASLEFLEDLEQVFKLERTESGHGETLTLPRTSFRSVIELLVLALLAARSVSG